MLDTAAHYESESSVGAAVEDAVRRGTVRRDEITICAKLWMDDLGYDSALRAARCSLERLRSERLDVFLVHFPGTIDAVQDPKRNRQLRADTWRALETLQRDGVAAMRPRLCGSGSTQRKGGGASTHREVDGVAHAQGRARVRVQRLRRRASPKDERALAPGEGQELPARSGG
mgnify:CR=1 FL=1